MKKTVILFTVFIVMGIAPLWAEGEDVMEIGTAVETALRNNLSLQSERIGLGTKERVQDNLWNTFLPSMSVSAGLSRSGGDTTSSQASSSPWGLSVGFQAGLPLSPVNKYSINDVKLSYKQGLLTLEEAEKLIEREVKKSFYNLILLKERIGITEGTIETAQKRYALTKTSYENGLVSELTMLNALVALEKLRPDLEAARLAYDDALLSFTYMLGFEPGTSITPAGTIEPEYISLDGSTLADEYLGGRLDVRSDVSALQILENERKLAKADEFMPSLSFSYSYNLGLNDPFTGSWSGENWTERNTFGISLSFPLDGFIPGSSSKVKIAGIDDSIEKARIELESTTRLGEIEIRTLVLGVKKSYRTLEVLKKNEELALKTWELTELEYGAGITDILTVEEASDTLAQARLDVIEEKYACLSGLIDLEYALNNSLIP